MFIKENTLEGLKLLNLLECESDWILDCHQQVNWSRSYECIKHIISGIKIIPYQSWFDDYVLIGIKNDSKDNFLNEEDHRILNKVSRSLMDKLRTKTARSNCKFRTAIAEAVSSSLPTCS